MALATKVKPKPKKPSTTAAELNAAAAALAKALSGAGGGAPATGASTKTPAGLGLTAAEAALPVVFSTPGQTENLATPKGATTNAKGQQVASVLQIMQQYFALDQDELKFFQDQMVNGHVLAAKDATGKPNPATQTAWRKMAIDAANAGTSFTSLVNMGASSGDYASLLAGLESDIASEQRQVAETKQGTYTETDPDQIKQAVVSAYASIGEAPPSPQFLDQFVAAFHGQEGAAETSALAGEKANYAGALTTLEAERNAVEEGNPADLAKLQGQPGAVEAVGKPTPNLDAEAMAQAKASDPAQYYATQSSYLYGLLLNDIRGTPNYQTAPTAPSATAPGGAIVGAPLIAAGG